MLQKLHERIKGWVATVIILVISATFVLWGVQYYFEQSAGNSDQAAKVNGVIITNQELAQAFSMLQNQMLARMGNSYNDAMKQQLKMYALQSIVTQTALYTTLSKEGFSVGLPQIKAMVMQTPQFQDNGQFSEQKFMQIMAQMNETPMHFLKRVQADWVVNQVMQGTLLSGLALPSEVNRWYAIQHQQRAFGYFIVPMQSFISKVTVTDAALKNYYQAQQNDYQIPEKVSVDYLLLSPTAIEKTVKVTEAEAKTYYQAHLANFKGQSFEKVRTKIMTLLQHQRVNDIFTNQTNQLSDLTYTNPSSLTAAAKAMNLTLQTSPLLTKSGEKTGIFADTRVLSAVFSDSVLQSGNNSSVISLQDGSQMVLRVAKKIPSAFMPLSTVHDHIKKLLVNQQATAQAGVLAYQLQTQITQGANPATVAKKNNFVWHAVPLMQASQKSAVPTAVITGAFSAPKGVQTVSVNQNDYAVIDVTQVKNADPSKMSPDTAKKMRAQLAIVWGQLLQHVFVNSVMKNSTIILSQQPQ